MTTIVAARSLRVFMPEWPNQRYEERSVAPPTPTTHSDSIEVQREMRPAGARPPQAARRAGAGPRPCGGPAGRRTVLGNPHRRMWASVVIPFGQLWEWPRSGINRAATIYLPIRPGVRI